ncbi:DUF1523 family protein [Actibacterium sp. 188UL27-1]|uniref:DUF1523 family protein n=1 Tax=Actibacterium sp. 188UL27-1 TaxID=2786961 RepID=UPI00195945C4|nr:DUF1523 family protein [Actibacterium sp. 188UL27-1]MBM7066370.1 DUF1523 family protein [Actibacterium sp. 188UL27-1]
MFYYIRWTLWAIFWLLIAAMLHYTLPQHDIVRVTGTEIIRQDFSGWNRMFYAQADSGNETSAQNRDLRKINTTRTNGRVMVYRNEDTGFFGWPPYFKLDSSNLQAEASDAISTRGAPEWYAVRHYGWRSEFLTIFPNAISLRPVEGPDTRIIPWFNIFFLIIFGAIIWAITSRIRRFRRKRIDPALAEVGEALDRVGDRAEAAGGRMGRWFDSFGGPENRR